MKLVCIREHRSLTAQPFTVGTDEGQFRIPKALWPTAKRAMEALDANGTFDGPDEGPLQQVLRDVAEAPDVPSALVVEAVAHDTDSGAVSDLGGLQLLADEIADECFAKLKDLAAEALRKRVESGRAALLSEVVKGLEERLGSR